MANTKRKKRREQGERRKAVGMSARPGTAKDSRSKKGSLEPIWSRTRDTKAVGCGTYHAGRKQLETTIEDVGPEKALEYLGTSGGNRGMNNHTVTRYANDMTRRRWVLTHQGIAFDIDGKLVDGHRRLNAIIKCGLTIKMSVTRNLSREAVAFLDYGEMRSEKDILAREGVPSPAKCIAMVKAAILGWNSRRSGDTSKDQNVTAVFENRSGIEWILNELGRKHRAPVMGAVLRAVVSEGQTKRLREFCNHLRDGTNGGRRCPVNALERYIEKVGAKTASGTHNDLYPRVTTALKRFLEGAELSNLVAAKGDNWPFDLN